MLKRAGSWPCKVVVLAILSGVAGTSRAQAAYRADLSVGPWSGNFAQSGAGQTVSLTPPVSPGAEGTLGFNIGPVFLEYQLSLLESVTMQANSARYESLFGLNFGIELSALPLEPYVGYESGNYLFTSGSQPAFSGGAFKAGTTLVLQRNGSVKIGIRGEARWQFIAQDQAGDLPAGYSTRALIYFLGLSLGVGR